MNSSDNLKLNKIILSLVFAIVRKYENFIEKFSYVIIGVAAIWAELDNISIYGFKPSDSLLFWLTICTLVILFVTNLIAANIQSSIENDFEKFKSESAKDKTQLIRRYEDLLFSERLQVLEESLQELYESLNFDMQERICIYAYREQDGHFVCRARYSSHPDLTKFSERKIYPGNDGIIGCVWHDGAHNGSLQDSCFPNPKTTTEAYYNYLEQKYNIPRNISENLRMKSIDLYAEVIRDTKRKAVAVIVFESEQKNKIDVNSIKNEYNQNMKVRIVDLLGKMQSHDIEGI